MFKKNKGVDYIVTFPQWKVLTKIIQQVSTGEKEIKSHTAIFLVYCLNIQDIYQVTAKINDPVKRERKKMDELYVTQVKHLFIASNVNWLY